MGKDKMMGGRILTFAALVFLAGCTTGASVSTGYYDVKGNTARALDRAIERQGPFNGHALASAELRFAPEVRHRVDGQGRCKISSARFKVEAHITLPRWQDRSGAPADLRRAFDDMAIYARKHEQVHVAIAEAAARAMEARLKAIPEQKSCAALERKALAAIVDVQKKHDRVQRQFDADEQRRLAALLREARKAAR